MQIDLSKPWQVIEGLTADEFLLGMAALGHSQEMTLVGAFEAPDDETKRTAHRDIPLPFHRDGIYTQSIADLQSGMYIERPNVDVVGMYCIRDNGDPCYTILADDEAGEHIVSEVNLRAGQALVWDNRLWHGRRGTVGQRVLIRFWITSPALYEARP
jgi:ectoine hydroxylase-related dioxygenase (phytanoyl-CoA dioxygenase family)